MTYLELEKLSLEERKKIFRALLDSVPWETPKELSPALPAK